MSWLGLLPFGILLLTCAAIFYVERSARRSDPTGTVADSTVRASIIWGAFIAIFTHVLSYFAAFSFAPVLVGYAVYALIAITIIARHKRAAEQNRTEQNRTEQNRTEQNRTEQNFSSIDTNLQLENPHSAIASVASFTIRRNLFTKFCVGGLAIILLGAMFTALAYPPTNWDSMTYHLPKAMHWIQNHSQAFYFTNIDRQNAPAPFAETIIAHSLLLGREDYWVNLVQFLSLSGALLLVARIAQLLGISRGGQLAAALFFATLPMAIAQASSTQNDLVESFWTLAVAERFLAWRKNHEKNPLISALYLGLAIGLAIQTKGVGYMSALPFALIFAYSSLREWRKLLLPAIAAGVAALMIFAPHCWRNYRAYGSFLAVRQTGNTAMKHFAPKYLLANFTANALSNIADRRIYRFHESAFTWFGVKFERLFGAYYGKPATATGHKPFADRHEDVAKNPLHFLLWLAAIIIAMTRLRGGAAGIARTNPLAKIYWYLTLGASLLFCTLVPWQPWLTRLQLPFFALGAPLVGALLSGFPPRLWQKTALTLLLVYALPSLLYLPSRRLIPSVRSPEKNSNYYVHFARSPREFLYFANRPDLYPKYREFAAQIAAKNPGVIALVCGGDSWEYPLWALLRHRMASPPRIEHFSRDDLLNHRAKLPETVITLDLPPPE